MSEPKERRGSRRRDWPVLAALVVALPILYLLGSGPMGWLYFNGYLPESAAVVVARAYEPLPWLTANFGPIDEFMDWYVDMFVGPTGRVVPPP